ncbi:hypothetical protein MVEN_00019100 [Mycena venus]|uniref:Uncharacterized protein n=1 Tax=Mycena venus TaxID=2733690 RepID=A0A8H7DHJ5_9AGAR|nr:hypothetical protein MVEN_00019100 [Mycena venus]
MPKDRPSKKKKKSLVRVPVTIADGCGGTKTTIRALNPCQRSQLHNATNQEMAAHIAALRTEQLVIFNKLRDRPDMGDNSEVEDGRAAYSYNDVAEGNVGIEISHGGGEMAALQEELVEEKNRKKKKGIDTRDRWDRTQRHVLGMRGQMSAITDAYVKWGATQGEYGLEGSAPEAPELDRVENTYPVRIIDIFSESLVPDKNSLRLTNFSLGMRKNSPMPLTTTWKFERVEKVLGQDAPDWRLKNCCPACTYKLEGEAKLIFEMLMAMDGNDSLKRVLTKEKGVDENGVPKRGGRERPDPRTADAGGTYFLSREKVDKWAKEVLDQLVKRPRSKDEEDESECQERWKNMSEELTAKMWGIFDETGVFLALCRHGFVLLVADMVRSGELAKYGLAITDALLDAFGADNGMGYDIGCGFSTTIKNSPLGDRAQALNFKTLVGAFHGHAHNRLCQLRYLATYVLGLGLEDLETCERTFSKTNGLARAIRYASVFHRRQSIATYLAHMDTFETYANLSTFLINNYKQALELIDLEDSLRYAMDQAGISGTEVFEERLQQELEYLKNLSKEPKEETDQMEYYQRLVNLNERHVKLKEAFKEGLTANGTVRRHARKNYDRAVKAVQEMEVKMDITVRWMVDDEEWEKAATLVASRRYRLAVNRLEQLVVKRLFELTKMNMSGTGYKLRKHIAKALQTRSKTIRAALHRYNEAAKSFSPPRHQLTWQEVIDFTFLSDFDILQDPEGNAAIRPWATPGARELMDTYFKIKRAREEIDRLNIEICQLVTYIKDEKEFLLSKEAEVRQTDPDLAFFIRCYHLQRGRFDTVHLKKLIAFVKEAGPKFTGTLEPGVRRQIVEPEPMAVDVSEEEREPAPAVETELQQGCAPELEDNEEWETDDSEDEFEEELLAKEMETVMVLAVDKEDDKQE